MVLLWFYCIFLHSIFDSFSCRIDLHYKHIIKVIIEKARKNGNAERDIILVSRKKVHSVFHKKLYKLWVASEVAHLYLIPTFEAPTYEIGSFGIFQLSQQ